MRACPACLQADLLQMKHLHKTKSCLALPSDWHTAWSVVPDCSFSSCQPLHWRTVREAGCIWTFSQSGSKRQIHQFLSGTESSEYFLRSGSASLLCRNVMIFRYFIPSKEASLIGESSQDSKQLGRIFSKGLRLLSQSFLNSLHFPFFTSSPNPYKSLFF